jgi:hypothetical protein
MSTTILAFSLGVFVGGLTGLLLVGLIMLMKERHTELQELPGKLEPSLYKPLPVRTGGDIEVTAVILCAVKEERAANTIVINSSQH